MTSKQNECRKSGKRTMTRSVPAALAITMVLGCTDYDAGNEGFVLTSGNRAAGTVTMSCNYNRISPCIPPTAANRQNAADACRKWGYTSAEPFGGVRTIPDPPEIVVYTPDTNRPNYYTPNPRIPYFLYYPKYDPPRFETRDSDSGRMEIEFQCVGSPQPSQGIQS